MVTYCFLHFFGLKAHAIAEVGQRSSCPSLSSSRFISQRFTPEVAQTSFLAIFQKPSLLDNGDLGKQQEGLHFRSMQKENPKQSLIFLACLKCPSAIFTTPSLASESPPFSHVLGLLVSCQPWLLCHTILFEQHIKMFS